MKNRFAYLKFFLGIIPVSLVLSCSDSGKKKNSNNAPAPVQALPVDAHIATEQKGGQWETAIGSLLANRSVTVMSEVPKKIVGVFFKDGTVVRKGQILYQLDDADIQARIREAAAELNLARINEQRLHELLKTEAVKQEEYDVALAKMQALQARLDNLKIERNKTSIRAPFSGVVGISRVFQGALVSPGIPMVDIQEQDQLRVSFTVPEKHLGSLHAGTIVSFATAGSEMQAAKVYAIDATVEMQSRNIIVHAITNNSRGALKPGMSVKVKFPVSGQQTTMAVPTDALMPGEQGFNVFVVRNGIAKTQAVTVTDRSEQEAYISTGLKKGDTVVTSNLMRAGEGTPVTVVTIH